MISDRVAVKELCVSTVAAALEATQGDDPDLSNVVVSFGMPTSANLREAVWFGDIEGNADPAVFGTQGSNDEYRIRAAVAVSGFTAEVDASRRAQLILNAVNEALFETPPGTPNPGRAEGAVIYPGRQNGPDGIPPTGGEPAAAVVEFDVVVSCAKRGT